MKSQSIRLFAISALIALSALAGQMGRKLTADIPSGTGYAAWDLCTRTMQSHEALDFVRARYVEPTVAPLPSVWSVDVVPGQRVAVRTKVPGLANERSAIYRAGLGCTPLPPGTDEAKVRAQPFVAAAALADDPRPWPRGEGAVETALIDANTQAVVDRHAEIIFSETSSDPKKQLNATALLVARDGHLIYERYGQHHDRSQPQIGWSMTKTLTAMIAGMMVRDGKLSLDQPIGIPKWQGTPKEAITWRQLLNMAPGLTWNEGHGGASDATEMLFSQPDQGRWAADRVLSATPGSVFTYSTGFTNIAMLRMRWLLGGQPQAIYDYYQRELFAPLGIRNGVIEVDASGTPVGGARGLLRPVDWLRLGELIATGGTWDGKVILPRDYLTFMSSPSPANPGYGGFMWLKASDMIEPALRATLPNDLVWLAGYKGQLVVVIPSQHLIVLRMGVSLGGTMEHDVARDQLFALVNELSVH